MVLSYITYFCSKNSDTTQVVRSIKKKYQFKKQE